MSLVGKSDQKWANVFWNEGLWTVEPYCGTVVLTAAIDSSVCTAAVPFLTDLRGSGIVQFDDVAS